MTKERQSKRYFWNSNAEQHGNMVFAMSVFSTCVSGIVSMLLGTAAFVFWDLTRYGGALVVLAMGGVFLGGWWVIFGRSYNAYYQLIESQVINPPDLVERVYREVLYQTENGYKVFKRDGGVGGVDEKGNV